MRLLRINRGPVEISPSIAQNYSPDPVWTRLNERYRGAVFLSQLVLKSNHLERTDNFRAFGAYFLVDMNRVFENVVGSALKRLIEEDYGGKLLLQYSAKAPINVIGRTREIHQAGIRRLAKAVGS